MNELKESIKALLMELLDVASAFLLVTPPRGWTGVTVEENGYMGFTAGTRVDWQFMAYLILRQINNFESYARVLQSFRDDETIAAKILWDSDQPDTYRLDAGPRATWVWDKVIEPYLVTCHAKHRNIQFDDEIFEATFAQLAL